MFFLVIFSISCQIDTSVASASENKGRRITTLKKKTSRRNSKNKNSPPKDNNTIKSTPITDIKKNQEIIIENKPTVNTGENQITTNTSNTHKNLQAAQTEKIVQISIDLKKAEQKNHNLDYIKLVDAETLIQAHGENPGKIFKKQSWKSNTLLEPFGITYRTYLHFLNQTEYARLLEKERIELERVLNIQATNNLFLMIALLRNIIAFKESPMRFLLQPGQCFTIMTEDILEGGAILGKEIAISRPLTESIMILYDDIQSHLEHINCSTLNIEFLQALYEINTVMIEIKEILKKNNLPDKFKDYDQLSIKNSIEKLVQKFNINLIKPRISYQNRIITWFKKNKNIAIVGLVLAAIGGLYIFKYSSLPAWLKEYTESSISTVRRNLETGIQSFKERLYSSVGGLKNRFENQFEKAKNFLKFKRNRTKDYIQSAMAPEAGQEQDYAYNNNDPERKETTGADQQYNNQETLAYEAQRLIHGEQRQDQQDTIDNEGMTAHINGSDNIIMNERRNIGALSEYLQMMKYQEKAIERKEKNLKEQAEKTGSPLISNYFDEEELERRNTDLQNSLLEYNAEIAKKESPNNSELYNNAIDRYSIRKTIENEMDNLSSKEAKIENLDKQLIEEKENLHVKRARERQEQDYSYQQELDKQGNLKGAAKESAIEEAPEEAEEQDDELGYDDRPKIIEENQNYYPNTQYDYE